MKKIEAAENRAQTAELIAAAKSTATLNERDQATLEKCEAALLRLDPPSNYENDGRGDLKRSVISERVAMLVGGFPNGAPSDPAVFVRLLFESICSVDVSLPALDSAVWEVLETKRFFPAISEVQEIVRKQQSNWGKRFCAIDEIAETSRWALQEIEKPQP